MAIQRSRYRNLSFTLAHSSASGGGSFFSGVVVVVEAPAVEVPVAVALEVLVVDVGSVAA